MNNSRQKKSIKKTKGKARRTRPSAGRPAAAASASERAVPRAEELSLSTAEEFTQFIKTAGDRRYVLRLYVTGSTQRSGQAITNIRSLCDEFLPGRYDLDVIDIYQQPDAAVGQQIIAAPTLVKELPLPARRMIGDLANRDRVLVGLDLHPKFSDCSAADAQDTRWVAL